MNLLKILQAQGIGSRKVCLSMIDDGEVFIAGEVCTNAKAQAHPDEVTFLYEGELCTCAETVFIAMNKPLGYECSAKPTHHPSVLDLIPAHFRARGVQPIGRLDVDTSGLLLLTDDGQLIHQLTHPKRHVHKHYLITTADAVSEVQLEQLRQPLLLNDDLVPVQAVSVTQLDTHQLEMVIDEGRYHQIRRMLGAVGNRVETLHRQQVGSFILPELLAEGKWQDILLAQVIPSSS
jgi:16S rRNA pseudouridine516 synthase